MNNEVSSVSDFFPFWNDLYKEHRDDLINHSQVCSFKQGEMVFSTHDECLGLILVKQGQLRAYILSDTGKEVTLYRLFERDICLFSSACIMKNIQFDIQVEAEEDTQALLIPSVLYDRLMNQSIQISNYTNQLMSGRFSEVMWKLEQILFKSMDSRIAHSLLELSGIAGSHELRITHDTIAKDLCTAREVVTRMLKYFSEDNIIELGRGKIRLLDVDRLAEIAG